MVVKKRRFDFFSDDFEDEFERMRREIERAMEDTFKGFDEREIERLSKDPNTKVYGFSIRITPQGKPVIREFGNIRPGVAKELTGEREPLVDVIEREKEVTVIAEVPGVERREIELNATDKTLGINVPNPERRYNKLIKLPCRVDPNSARAHYKNGVLEVRLDKMKEEKKEGKTISVE